MQEQEELPYSCISLQEYLDGYQNQIKKVINDLVIKWGGSSRRIYDDIVCKNQDRSLDSKDFLGFKYQTPLIEDKICSKIFNKGDKLYRCKTCQFNKCAVLCPQCFHASDHKGHNFSIGTSGGGCCDCGDQHAWDMKGACPTHSKKTSHQEISKAIMSQTKQKFNQQIGFCMAYLITRYFYAKKLQKDNNLSEKTMKKIQRKTFYFGQALMKYLIKFNSNNFANNVLTQELFSKKVVELSKNGCIMFCDQNLQLFQLLMKMTQIQTFSQLASDLLTQLLKIPSFRIKMTIQYTHNYTESTSFAVSGFQKLSCQLLVYSDIIKQLVLSEQLTPITFAPQYDELNFDQFKESYRDYFKNMQYLLTLSNQESSRIYIQYHIMSGCMPNMGHYRKLSSEYQEMSRYNFDQYLVQKFKRIPLLLLKDQEGQKVMERAMQDLLRYIIIELQQIYQFDEYFQQYVDAGENFHQTNINQFFFLPQQLMLGLFIFAYFHKIDDQNQNNQNKLSQSQKINKLIQVLKLQVPNFSKKHIIKMIQTFHRCFILAGLCLGHPQTKQRFYSYYQFMFLKNSSLLSIQLYLYKILIQMLILIKENQMSQEESYKQNNWINQFPFILKPLKDIENRLNTDSFKMDHESIFDRKKLITKLTYFLHIIIQATQTDIHEILVSNLLQFTDKNKDQTIKFCTQILKKSGKMPLKQFKSILEINFQMKNQYFQNLVTECSIFQISEGAINLKDQSQKSKENKTIAQQSQLNLFYFKAFKNKISKLCEDNKQTFKVPQSKNHILSSFIPFDYIKRLCQILQKYLTLLINNKSEEVAGISQLLIELIKIKRAFINEEKSDVVQIIKFLLEKIINSQVGINLFDDQTKKIIIAQTQNIHNSQFQQKMQNDKQTKLQQRKRKLIEKRNKKVEKFKQTHKKFINEYPFEDNQIKEQRNTDQIAETRPFSQKICIVCRQNDQRDQEGSSTLIMTAYAQLSDLYETFIVQKLPTINNCHLVFKSCGHYIHKNCFDKLNINKKQRQCQLCKSYINCWFPVNIDQGFTVETTKPLILTQTTKEIFNAYSVLWQIDQGLRKNCLNSFGKALHNSQEISQKLYESLLFQIIFLIITFTNSQINQTLKKKLQIYKTILKTLKVYIMAQLIGDLSLSRKQYIERQAKAIRQLLFTSQSPEKTQNIKSQQSTNFTQQYIQNYVKIGIFNYIYDQNFKRQESVNYLSFNQLKTIQNVFEFLTNKKFNLCQVNQKQLQQGMLDEKQQTSIQIWRNKIKIVQPPQNLQKLLQMRKKCQNCLQYSNQIMICMICGWKGCRNCPKVSVFSHTNQVHCGNSIYLSCNAGNIYYVSRNKYWIDNSIYVDIFGNQFEGFNRLNQQALKDIQQCLLNYTIYQTIRNFQVKINKIYSQPI